MRVHSGTQFMLSRLHTCAHHRACVGKVTQGSIDQSDVRWFSNCALRAVCMHRATATTTNALAQVEDLSFCLDESEINDVRWVLQSSRLQSANFVT